MVHRKKCFCIFFLAMKKVEKYLHSEKSSRNILLANVNNSFHKFAREKQTRYSNQGNCNVSSKFYFSQTIEKRIFQREIKLFR